MGIMSLFGTRQVYRKALKRQTAKNTGASSPASPETAEAVKEEKEDAFLWADEKMGATKAPEVANLLPI